MRRLIIYYKKCPVLPGFFNMRVEGVEPTHPKALDPKSSVSASSTTLALIYLIRINK